MSWNKKDISYQCQLVQFRNGLTAIAINDKIDKNDFDGDEVFMIYDLLTRSFIGSKRVVCYSEDLRCELSLKGIINQIDNVINNNAEKSELADSDWDIVKQTRYPYALDAFMILSSGDSLDVETERIILCNNNEKHLQYY